MRFLVRHRTAYRYARPVLLQPHRMMLSPRGSHDLVVVSRALTVSPQATVVWTQDVFGNLIATASFAATTDELVIEAEMTVEQSAVAWPVFDIAVHAQTYPFAYSDDETTDLGALRSATVSDAAWRVVPWARGFVAGPVTDTLSLLKDVNAGVLGSVVYRIRDEEGTQRADETLEKGSGSCRDIAALFIDAARHLGFGARAVSGYLFDPDASLSDPGSTHAWAEVYLPGAGWIAFDPTHRRVGGANLVPVAVGRSNGQIMPIAGGYLGAPGDFVAMDVGVRVTPVT